MEIFFGQKNKVAAIMNYGSDSELKVVGETLIIAGAVA